MTNRIRAREPEGEVRPGRRLTARDELAPFLEDEAHFPGGHAPCVLLPRTEGEVAHALREAPTALPVGARSSLTGGATPFGDWVLALERMDALQVGPGERVTAQAGVPIQALQTALDGRGFWYPPVPTFMGALVGGVVSTNAAGAATFKYGATREWVRKLTVVLACGEVLELERGQAKAHPGGWFEVQTRSRGLVTVPLPTYRMPAVSKRSAGYHAEPEMDPIDLFIGSEGTLGVVTAAEFAVVRKDFSVLVAMVPLRDEPSALALVSALREASLATRSGQTPGGLDVSAVEYLDARCLRILTEDGEARKNGVTFAPEDGAAVLLQAELPGSVDAEAAFDQIGSFEESTAPDTPLIRLCRLLARHGAVERMEVAVPGDTARAAQLFAIREAVPVGVNQRVGRLKRELHPSIQKVAADMVVPYENFAEMMSLYRAEFERRGLDHAIWGHVSDGNVHPNVIPRGLEDVESGKAAVFSFGREVARLGGCPLSEHGTGRNPVKQQLLRQLYGDEGLEQMRAVKRALDPEWKLAPGVIFSR